MFSTPMFIIESTPSAALLEDCWKTLEETRSLEDANDYLKSPHVDLWQDTLLRVRKFNVIQASGIWHDGQFVDLSHDSKIGEHFTWHINKESDKYMKSCGFPDAWKGCRFPSWMMQPFIKIKFTKAEIFPLALAVVKDCQSDDSNASQLDILTREPLRAHEVLRDPSTRSIHAINYLATCITEYSDSIWFIQEAMRISMSLTSNEKAADILRKHMTFPMWVNEFFNDRNYK